MTKCMLGSGALAVKIPVLPGLNDHLQTCTNTDALR